MLGILDIIQRGGEGSGHFGHAGRPGLVGGSSPSGEEARIGHKLSDETYNSLMQELKPKLSVDEKYQLADAIEGNGLTDGLRVGKLTDYGVRSLKVMDTLFQKAPKLGKDVTLYRTMEKSVYAKNLLKEGNTFRDEGFVSTTYDKGMLDKIAREFSATIGDIFDGPGPWTWTESRVQRNWVKMDIVVPKGTAVIPMTSTISPSKMGAYYDWQKEVLLPRSGTFTVVKNDGKEVVLEFKQNPDLPTFVPRGDGYWRMRKKGNIRDSRFIWREGDVVLLNDGVTKGGPGSGNFGHAGRPGLVGGSQAEGEEALFRSKYEPLDRSFFNEQKKELVEWGKSLSKAGRSALAEYTGSRGATTDPDAMDTIMTYKLPVDVKLYRNGVLEQVKDYKVGDTVVSENFVSATWHRPARLPSLEIHVPKGTGVAVPKYARDIGNPYRIEMEVILPRNSVFKVVKREKRNVSTRYGPTMLRKRDVEVFTLEMQSGKTTKDVMEEVVVKEEKKAIQEQIINSIRIGIERALKGGEGSGNFGHAGRPGKVGGSSPDGRGAGEAVMGAVDTIPPADIFRTDGKIDMHKYEKLNGKEKAKALFSALARYDPQYVPKDKVNGRDKDPEWKEKNDKVGILERIRAKFVERFIGKAKEAGKDRAAGLVGLDRRKGMRAALIFQFAGLQLALEKRKPVHE